MLASTHIVFSSTLYLGGATLFGYDVDPVGWGIAALASLGPDMDLPTSRVGRPLYWISTRLEKQFGHRTVTHSFAGLAALAILAAPLLLLDVLWFWCLLGGWWSHVWIDMLNVRGVDLTWPSPARWVLPGRREWRIEVGSKAEMILLSGLIVVTVALYPLSSMGFRGGLQLLIANFDIAREEFIKDQGSHWYRLELVATDNLTLEQVQCECPVLGVWQGGLIVLQEGRPRAVGESQTAHNLYPLQARLLEGEPLRVVSARVDMRGRSLRWLLGQINTGRTYYLSGEVQVGEKVVNVGDIDLYSPASYRGNVLRLHYARAEELEPWLDLTASQGEIYVQFWLRPGDPPVGLAIEETAPVDMVPAGLRKWL